MSTPKLSNSIVLKEIKPSNLEEILHEYLTEELGLEVKGYDQNGPQWIYDLIYYFPEEEHYLYKQDQRELAKLKAHTTKDQIMDFLVTNDYKTEIGSVTGVELQEEGEDFYVKFQVIFTLPSAYFSKLNEAEATIGEEIFFSLNHFKTLQEVPSELRREFKKHLVKASGKALFNPKVNLEKMIKSNCLRWGVNPKELIILDDDQTGGVAFFTSNPSGLRKMLEKLGLKIKVEAKKIEFQNSYNYINPDTNKIYVYKTHKDMFMDNQGRLVSLTPEERKKLVPLVNEINVFEPLKLKEGVNKKNIYGAIIDIEDCFKQALKKTKATLTETSSMEEAQELAAELRKIMSKTESILKQLNKL